MRQPKTSFGRMVGHLAAALAAGVLAASSAFAADPIKIGFSMAQSGPLAGSGKSALLAMKIWAEDQNAKGGLLGRPVQLIYYDDQSSPANVPPIYTKLLDVDKVDLVVSGYATPIIAAALPIAMQHDMVLMGLFGLANNAKLKYDKYFGVAPIGEDPVNVLAKPFFDVADTLNPKPSTIAVVTPDIQFGHAALEGVRNAAKARNMKVVYDRTFPPSMTDFSTLVREVQATNPDLVFVATQPGQSINVARAIAEVGLNAQMIGGGMTGLQTTDSETILGPQINGLVNFAYWLPAAKLQSPGAMDFLSKYQARAKAEGVDPIGYYVAPWAYADLQMLAEAVEGTKSLEGDKLAAYLHGNKLNTIIGEVEYGPGGEWKNPRQFLIQFQNIKSKDPSQFTGTDHLVVVGPPELKSGDLIAPFDKARQ